MSSVSLETSVTIDHYSSVDLKITDGHVSYYLWKYGKIYVSGDMIELE